MAEMPSSVTSLSETASSPGSGTNWIAVIAPVPTHADSVPRVYANSKAIYDYHGYSDGLEFSALFMKECAKPVIFVGIPIATPGTVGRFDASGNTGTSVVTCAVGEPVSVQTRGVVSFARLGVLADLPQALLAAGT